MRAASTRLRDGLPLVVARKNQALARRGFALSIGRSFGFAVREAAQNIEPGVARKYLLPQIRSRVAIGVGRIARAFIVALIEGQKAGFRAFEPRRHVDFVAAGGEMHQSAPVESEQRLIGVGFGVARRAVVLILPDGILHGLGEIGFEFQRCGRNAVDEKHQVDAIFVVQRITHLTHHGTAHLSKAFERGRIESVFRLPLAHRELRVDVFEAVAQNVQRAVLIERLRQTHWQVLAGCLRPAFSRFWPIDRAGFACSHASTSGRYNASSRE